MFQPKRVLCVIDPAQQEQPALSKLEILAKQMTFDVHLLSVDYTQYLIEGYYFEATQLADLRAAFLREKETELENLASRLRAQGISVTTKAKWGHPAFETIIEYADTINAELIIRHCRQHGALSRLFLSNDDWQLIRCAPQALLLIKEQPWSSPMKILAAVDPMHERHKPDGLDHKILDAALSLAAQTGGSVDVVHAFARNALSIFEIDHVKEQHGVHFDALTDEFKIEKNRRHLIDEAPEYAIETLTREHNMDVVIAGGVTRSQLADALIGSTTEKLLDFLASDILILKPDGYQSPLAK